MFSFKKNWIFHVDVNSAFLSWEAVYRLQKGGSEDLRKIPSAIGGDGLTNRGIICAKSIPAKKMGVKTGESIIQALNKCPNLKMIPGNYELYMKSSKSMFELLGNYTQNIYPYSIDECFLDLSDRKLLFKDPIETAYKIKEDIKKQLGFTVSIGVSESKVLAKMASELKKPDAVSSLFVEEIKEKMWPLDVGELFMVGRATSKKLKKIGINTIGELALADCNFLEKYLKSHGQIIHSFANGFSNIKEDKKFFGTRDHIKSIGNSKTINFEVDNINDAMLILLSLTEKVSGRVRDYNFWGTVVHIMYKTKDFKVVEQQSKLNCATDNTMKIFKKICQLFKSNWQGEIIRSLGVRVSGFVENEINQINILDEFNAQKNNNLDYSIDKIRKKYIGKSIQRASFINSGIESYLKNELDKYENKLLFH